MNNYFLFLGESGTSSLKNIDERFPVLALTGVLISEVEYDRLCERILNLAKNILNHVSLF